MRARLFIVCRSGVLAMVIWLGGAIFPLAAQAPATALKSALPAAAPESVGLSSERLERITRAAQAAVDAGRLAGGVVLVARHGKIAYFKAVGDADREARIPMRTDHIFRIASMTKPITCTAVMMLYEDGKFMLNQPVADFIPEFKNMKVLDPPFPQDQTSPPGALVDAQRPVTIYHLLTHTSGLTYGGPRLGKAYGAAGIQGSVIQNEGTIGDAMKRLALQPLLFQPGDLWEYGRSSDVLGYLVEVVSGMPLDRFFEERIFRPLGMKDTYFFVPDEKVSRLARAYTYHPDKGLQPIADGQVVREGEAIYTADYPYRGPRTYFGGGGGLSSTTEDFYHFCQMMLDGGQFNGQRLLSRKTVELMTQNRVQGKLEDAGYGLGFGVDSDPKFLSELGSVGTYYWGGFFYTSFIVDPREELIVIFMAQLAPTGGLDINQKVTVLAYQAIQD